MKRPYFMLTLLAVAGILGAFAGEWAKQYISSNHRNNKGSGIGLVVLGDETFDFGNVPQNESLKHIFTVTNTSVYDIRIVEHGSSCSCTVLANVEGLVLHPGDTLELPISIGTGKGEGRMRSLVSLHCQSLREGETKEGLLTLGIELTIVPEYWVYPKEIDFGEIHTLMPVRQGARLRANSDHSVRILRIESNEKAFSAVQVASLSAEDDQYIEVVFSGVGFLRTGLVTGIITIHTDSKRLPSKQILCKAKFVPPVEVSPSSIVVDCDQRGDITQRFTVTTANPAEIRINSREPYFSVIYEKRDGRKRVHNFDVIVRDPDYEGFTAEVKVQIMYSDDTVGSGVATVSIPVYRLAQRKGVD